MFEVSHRIAGLTFRTESNARQPRLHEEPFAHFVVENDVAPDVLHRLHCITLDSLTLSPPAAEKREQILQGVHVEPDAVDSPLLRAPAVRTWLRASLERPAEVGIWLYRERLVGHDFARRVLNFFYLETYGQGREEKGPEVRRQAGDDGKLEPCLRMHKVMLDPQAAKPLPADEWQRLAQNISFSPSEMLDMPLLRAPVVWTWLQAGLARSEKMLVSLHMDGVMVWNENQKTLDFFYQPEYGDSPEGYVAVHFRQVFSTFLPDFSALMVHSSGVIRRDRAALFLASDEGGKTTVLRHSIGGSLLNDDQIVLRRQGDAFFAHATPLGRMTSGPCQARLGAFFVLEKAPFFELEPVKPANLVRQLWDEHRIYTSVLPRHLKLCAFDLFYDACHQVPVYRMRFPRNFVDWEAIDAAMGV